MALRRLASRDDAQMLFSMAAVTLLLAVSASTWVVTAVRDEEIARARVSAQDAILSEVGSELDLLARFLGMTAVESSPLHGERVDVDVAAATVAFEDDMRDYAESSLEGRPLGPYKLRVQDIHAWISSSAFHARDVSPDIPEAGQDLVKPEDPPEPRQIGTEPEGSAIAGEVNNNGTAVFYRAHVTVLVELRELSGKTVASRLTSVETAVEDSRVLLARKDAAFGARVGDGAEVERLVRYMLASVAQARVVNGFGVAVGGTFAGTSERYITEAEVKLAVRFASLLEIARTFHTLPSGALAQLDATSPAPAERSLEHLVAAYGHGDAVDPADLFAIHLGLNQTRIAIEPVAAQALNAIVDQWIGRYLGSKYTENGDYDLTKGALFEQLAGKTVSQVVTERMYDENDLPARPFSNLGERSVTPPAADWWFTDEWTSGKQDLNWQEDDTHSYDVTLTYLVCGTSSFTDDGTHSRRSRETEGASCTVRGTWRTDSESGPAHSYMSGTTTRKYLVCGGTGWQDDGQHRRHDQVAEGTSCTVSGTWRTDTRLGTAHTYAESRKYLICAGDHGTHTEQSQASAGQKCGVRWTSNTRAHRYVRDSTPIPYEWNDVMRLRAMLTTSDWSEIAAAVDDAITTQSSTSYKDAITKAINDALASGVFAEAMSNADATLIIRPEDARSIPEDQAEAIQEAFEDLRRYYADAAAGPERRRVLVREILDADTEDVAEGPEKAFEEALKKALPAILERRREILTSEAFADVEPAYWSTRYILSGSTASETVTRVPAPSSEPSDGSARSPAQLLAEFRTSDRDSAFRTSAQSQIDDQFTLDLGSSPTCPAQPSQAADQLEIYACALAFDEESWIEKLGEELLVAGAGTSYGGSLIDAGFGVVKSVSNALVAGERGAERQVFIGIPLGQPLEFWEGDRAIAERRGSIIHALPSIDAQRFRTSGIWNDFVVSLDFVEATHFNDWTSLEYRAYQTTFTVTTSPLPIELWVTSGLETPGGEAPPRSVEASVTLDRTVIALESGWEILGPLGQDIGVPRDLTTLGQNLLDLFSTTLDAIIELVLKLLDELIALLEKVIEVVNYVLDLLASVEEAIDRIGRGIQAVLQSANLALTGAFQAAANVIGRYVAELACGAIEDRAEQEFTLIGLRFRTTLHKDGYDEESLAPKIGALRAELPGDVSLAFELGHAPKGGAPANPCAVRDDGTEFYVVAVASGETWALRFNPAEDMLGEFPGIGDRPDGADPILEESKSGITFGWLRSDEGVPPHERLSVSLVPEADQQRSGLELDLGRLLPTMIITTPVPLSVGVNLGMRVDQAGTRPEELDVAIAGLWTAPDAKEDKSNEKLDATIESALGRIRDFVEEVLRRIERLLDALADIVREIKLFVGLTVAFLDGPTVRGAVEFTLELGDLLATLFEWIITEARAGVDRLFTQLLGQGAESSARPPAPPSEAPTGAALWERMYVGLSISAGVVEPLPTLEANVRMNLPAFTSLPGVPRLKGELGALDRGAACPEDGRGGVRLDRGIIAATCRTVVAEFRVDRIGDESKEPATDECVVRATQERVPQSTTLFVEDLEGCELGLESRVIGLQTRLGGEVYTVELNLHEENARPEKVWVDLDTFVQDSADGASALTVVALPNIAPRWGLRVEVRVADGAGRIVAASSGEGWAQVAQYVPTVPGTCGVQDGSGSGAKVVLVHGLFGSRCGLVELGNRLVGAGYNVVDSDPRADGSQPFQVVPFEGIMLPYLSAKVLAGQLRAAELRGDLGGTWDAVGHSAGGLMLRALIERPPGAGEGRYATGVAPDGETGDTIPGTLAAPGRLVMLGTPNQGARVAAAIEGAANEWRSIKECVTYYQELATGGGSDPGLVEWAGVIAGLTRDSAFTTQLNAGAPPASTLYRIVAGKIDSSPGDCIVLVDETTVPGWDLPQRLVHAHHGDLLRSPQALDAVTQALTAG